MEPIGWEIKPAGWLVILILMAAIAHYIVLWLQNPSDQNQ
jgi:phage shock protein PspC (stress-responsive transcriptional regulator)